MIQRIQSIWLLLASACAFLSLKFSFYDGTYAVNNEYHQLTGTDNIQLLLTTCLLGALALFTIFLFKNRKLQLRLCIAGILHRMYCWWYCISFETLDSQYCFCINTQVQLLPAADLGNSSF